MNFEGGTFKISVEDEGEGIPDMLADPDIERKLEQLEPSRTGAGGGMGLF